MQSLSSPLKNPQPEGMNLPPPPSGRKRKTNTYQNVTALKILLNAIALFPKTQLEIIEITGLCNSTVSRWVNHLHTSTRENKNLIYVAEWRRVGKAGNWSACWQLGYDMPDAPKPKALTSAEYNKRWRKAKATAPTISRTDKGLTHVAR